ncbi:proteasomal ATPase-associated factor 1 [Zerene cesonia]|uniref:proteasomal ATPase-associated factor 1 n=1 Tax=Zerene cesonia TaxID=33412 RepID=UPI0018E4F549|nr:proteasomal ATPase-associated factor 1 [Zerene cesonia]
MSNLPVVSIQCDWNDVLRLPHGKAWISSKYLNVNSIHDKISASLDKSDVKVKLHVPETFQLISYSNLSLALRHYESGLKVAFVAPTKVHGIHKKAIISLCAADNFLTVSSCEDDKLLVWDNRSGDQLLDLKGHGGPIYKCRFFPSGIVVISAGADGSSRIWSAQSGINPVTLKGHVMAVMDVCIIEKGRNVITVSKDGTAKLWDVGESKCLDDVLKDQGPINCCALAITQEDVAVENDREVGTGNKILLIGCESGIVTAAHIAKREQIFQKKLESACNACIVVDQTIIVGCADGKIIHMKMEDGEIIKEIHESASPILCITALSNNLYVVGRQDGNCAVLSLHEGHETIRVQLTGSDCDGIRDASFNGKWIFVGCRDTNVRKYDYNQLSVHFK